MTTKRVIILIISLVWAIQTIGQKPHFEILKDEKKLFIYSFSKYYYSSFDIEQPSNFKLLSNTTISKVEISPLNDKIPFSQPDTRSLNFAISEPGQYMIRINDSIKVFLFAEKPLIPIDNNVVNVVTKYNIDTTGKINETLKIQKALNEISGSGKILYFPRGRYKAGQIFPRSNSRIRFDKGAVLNADTSSVNQYFPTDDIENRRFIYLNGVENIEITGQGIINGNGAYLRSRYGDDARVRLILAVNSKNILIEGLVLKDPGSWNTQVIKCNGVILRNLKLLNDIDLPNTDGFDPDASTNVLIENCFAYCGDDNVAVKVTGKKGLAANVDNVIVRGCVFLTKKSALKVGTETRSDFMKNIAFINNDILECDRGMALYVNDGATLDSISFINNRFERNHPDAQKKAIHFEVDKRNQDSKLGLIKNVFIKDCTFLKPFPNKSVIEYNGATTGITVIIENLVINGQKVETLESARINSIKSIVNFK